MKKTFLHRGAAFLFCTLATSPATASQLTPNVTLDSEFRLQAFDQNNANLGTSSSRNTASSGAESLFRLTANFTPSTLFYWEGRGVGTLGRGGFESTDTGAFSNNTSFLEWRQSYVEFNTIHDEPAYARLGRQRFHEPYGLWWSRDFDAARIGYVSTVFTGALSAGEDLFSYNTSHTNLRNNDKNKARAMAEGSWQYFYENFIEARAMIQNDYSGVASPGSTEPSDNPNDTDGHLAWGGLRAAGQVHSLFDGENKIRYRADLLGVTGTETANTTTASGPGVLTVTGVNHRHVRGWAFDTGVDIPLVQESKTQLHLGYAYGSGDGNATDSTDHAFRPTGLNGNFSKIGALSQNADNYGTVLRPELTNLHIFAAGFTRPVLTAADAGILYRYYRLADTATSLSQSGVLNTLNDTSHDLGQGIDVLFNMDLLKQYNMTMAKVHDFTLRTSLGGFRTGSAYGTADGKIVLRGLAELKLNF
jgi:hypothetical protein